MVIHDLRAHGGKKLIKALSRCALEERVAFALRAHAVNHLAAAEVFVDHPVHGVNVVLTVAVDGYGDITAILRLHQTGENGVLVAAVAALAYADAALVRLCKTGYDVPSAVPASVVNEQKTAVGGYFALGSKLPEFIEKHGSRYWKHLLLVIAGDHNV